MFVDETEKIDQEFWDNLIKRNNNILITANVKQAKRVLKLIDNVYNIYIKSQLKELEIVPIISLQRLNLENFEDSYFDTKRKQRIKRKLYILQKVYIEGNPKEILGDDYIETKTFVNDKASLIEDLSILLFGVDGLNYKILEKNGIVI